MVESLRNRIDICVKKRAALDERRSRAEADLKAAEDALKEFGLKPSTARATIEKAEAKLVAEVAEIERILDIA